jgi:hypothetical protein
MPGDLETSAACKETARRVHKGETYIPAHNAAFAGAGQAGNGFMPDPAGPWRQAL